MHNAICVQSPRQSSGNQFALALSMQAGVRQITHRWSAREYTPVRLRAQLAVLRSMEAGRTGW